MESDLLELLIQTVTIEHVTGRDGYGKPTYGSATVYPARVVGKVRMVRGADGVERVSSATVYLNTTDTLTTDRVTLPGGAKPLILSLGTVPDDKGTHHQVLYV